MTRKKPARTKKKYKYFLYLDECCTRCGFTEVVVLTEKDLNGSPNLSDLQFYTKKELMDYCAKNDLEVDI